MVVARDGDGSTTNQRRSGLSHRPRRAVAGAGLAALLGLWTLAGGCRRIAPSAPSGVPHRVVSLAPNLTEIVFAIGAGESLVGVSDYSDFPPEARDLPRVGGLEVSAERVVSLRPDLVLATPEGNAKGPVMALTSARVRVLVVPGGSLDGVLEGIRRVAHVFGRDRAGEQLVAHLSARREAVRRRVARRRRPAAVLLVWPDPPQAAGGETFLNDLLTEAGAQNDLAGRRGWPLVSPEWLATAPIEVVVIPDSQQTRRAYERAFTAGPLSRGPVSRAHLIRVEESILTRPGPRVFDALEQLAQEIHP